MKPDQSAGADQVDQGSWLTSKKLDLWAYAIGVTLDFSRPDSPTDNATMESFFSSLKTERVRRKAYRIRDAARAAMFDYIERFNNTTRRHSTIGYLNPVAFERRVMLA